MISDVTTTTVASEIKLFVIMAWITIHFSRKPRNGGSPPRDSNDVNYCTVNLHFPTLCL